MCSENQAITPSEQNLLHEEPAAFGAEQQARTGSHVAAPPGEVFADGTVPGEYPQRDRTAPPQDAEPVAACTVTGIEPQAYVHQGVAEGDPAGIFRAMAHALRQAAVHRRDGREVAHTAAGREPEPHRGVVGKPFGVLVGAHLGIVAGDEVAARQRGAVGDGEPAKQVVEVGKVLLVIGFGEAGVLVIVAGARIAHPARGVGLQQVGLHLQLAGVAPPVVAVAVGHVFPAAGLERAAVVGTPAHVALARDETHAAGVFRRVFAANSGRGVRTAIVAQHQLDPERGLLRQHALDGLGKVSFVVVGGHADRHKGGVAIAVIVWSVWRIWPAGAFRPRRRRPRPAWGRWRGSRCAARYPRRIWGARRAVPRYNRR